LKIPIENLPVLTPGATDSLKKGSTMVVIGNSLGVFPSVAVGGFLEIRDDGMILLDLHVPPGSCGSPVLDEAGRLIGIWIGHSRKESNDAADAGLGLALPVEKMIPALEALLVPPNGWVGISVIDLERNVFGKGVRVIGVTPDGPAAKAAIAVGDTLVGFRGKPVETAASLARRVRLCKPGTPEVFMVHHAGRELARRIDIQAGP
jgi:S1-C subfamily serine protease